MSELGYEAVVSRVGDEEGGRGGGGGLEEAFIQRFRANDTKKLYLPKNRLNK